MVLIDSELDVEKTLGVSPGVVRSFLNCGIVTRRGVLEESALLVGL